MFSEEKLFVLGFKCSHKRNSRPKNEKWNQKCVEKNKNLIKLYIDNNQVILARLCIALNAIDWTFVKFNKLITYFYMQLILYFVN